MFCHSRFFLKYIIINIILRRRINCFIWWRMRKKCEEHRQPKLSVSWRWARLWSDRRHVIVAPTTTSSMRCEDGWKWYTFLKITKVVSFQCSQEARSREKIVYTSSKAFLPLPLFLPKNISEWLIVLAEASLWSETIFTMPNEKAK